MSAKMSESESSQRGRRPSDVIAVAALASMVIYCSVAFLLSGHPSRTIFWVLGAGVVAVYSLVLNSGRFWQWHKYLEIVAPVVAIVAALLEWYL